MRCWLPAFFTLASTPFKRPSSSCKTGGSVSDWLDQVKFDAQGLVTAVAQDASSHRVLMVAFMNRQALEETAQTGWATYFSRSRQKLWRKGEESGHRQRVLELRLDCDGDVVLLQIDQAGGIACHTGRASCFYSVLKDGQWQPVDPVLKDPEAIYGK
ncbi:phosphoribosyl-AMP cyclohydrolase [Betaproteobacteria bacterium LSUCC0115]|nr:phosphoribosyl-AMP cyclohydrolase [Burkholderiales bacterium LSUCC0115]